MQITSLMILPIVYDATRIHRTFKLQIYLDIRFGEMVNNIEPVGKDGIWNISVWRQQNKTKQYKTTQKQQKPKRS